MTIHQLHPQGHPFTWQERLDQATCETDVVEVARDYLATLNPHEYASLPEALRPGKIVDANDVTTYAFDLVRQQCQEPGAQHAAQRLAHIMSRASIRLSEIMVSDRQTSNQRSA